MCPCVSVSMRTANVFLSFDDPECVCGAKKAYQLAEGTHRDLYDAVHRPPWCSAPTPPVQCSDPLGAVLRPLLAIKMLLLDLFRASELRAKIKVELQTDAA